MTDTTPTAEEMARKIDKKVNARLDGEEQLTGAELNAITRWVIHRQGAGSEQTEEDLLERITEAAKAAGEREGGPGIPPVDEGEDATIARARKKFIVKK